jgi:hypothetical protein
LKLKETTKRMQSELLKQCNEIIQDGNRKDDPTKALEL